MRIARHTAGSLDFARDDKRLRVCRHGAAGEMKQLQNLTAQLQERGATPIPRTFQRDRNGPVDSSGPLRHDEDAVAHVDRFVDVVGDEKHRGAADLPEAQDFILHPHPREGIERAERFIEEKNSRVIDERTSESDPLGHPAGKMMRIGIRKSVESDEVHEFIDLVAILMENAPRDETGLDVAANSQPREKIWVLENEAPLSVRTSNWFRANQEFAGVGRIEASNEAKEGGFAAAARTDERN